MLQMQGMLMYAASSNQSKSRNHVVSNVDPNPLNAIASLESQLFGANQDCYINSKSHEDENSTANLYMFANDLPGKIDHSSRMQHNSTAFL